MTHTTPRHTLQKFHSAVKDSIRQAKRRGKYAFDAGRYSEAAQWYSEALTLGESAPDPEEITQEQVLYNTPKGCMPELVPQPPPPPLAQVALYVNRATAWAKLGDFQKAVADSEAALALDPRSPRATTKKGQALLKLRQFAQASSTFMSGLQHHPTDEVHTQHPGLRHLASPRAD